MFHMLMGAMLTTCTVVRTRFAVTMVMLVLRSLA
jgi:hypothetical protein